MKPEHSGWFRFRLLLGALVVVLPLIATGFSPAWAATGQITGYGGKRRRARRANSPSAQQWTVATDGTIRALGKCLDVASANSANGTKVQIYDCNGTAAQSWTAAA